MMGRRERSVSCRVCGRSTWDVTGLCPRHRRSQRIIDDGPVEDYEPPTPSGRCAATGEWFDGDVA